MDDYRQLQEHLRNVAGGRKTISIYQGIVKSVDGNLCEVTVSHPGGTFTTVKPMESAKTFDKGDYEDDKIKH